MKKLLLLIACVSCSSAQLPDEGSGIVHDAGSMCTPSATDAEALQDASDASDATAHADADASDAADGAGSTGSTSTLSAPWMTQSCWFGAQAYLPVPPCPHGTYVVCFGDDAGGLSYCDDTPIDCHLDPVSGRWHCPAGTRTLNIECNLETVDVAMWPSTYSYSCTNGSRP
jgi:hypothetical protein